MDGECLLQQLQQQGVPVTMVTRSSAFPEVNFNISLSRKDVIAAVLADVDQYKHNYGSCETIFHL